MFSRSWESLYERLETIAEQEQEALEEVVTKLEKVGAKH